MPISRRGREVNLVILNSYLDLKSKKLSEIQFPSISDVMHLNEVRQLITEIEEMEVKPDAEIKQATKTGKTGTQNKNDSGV